MAAFIPDTNRKHRSEYAFIIRRYANLPRQVLPVGNFGKILADDGTLQGFAECVGYWGNTLGRPANPTIQNFESRVAWIIKHLVPDPTLADSSGKNKGEVKGVYEALKQALDEGRFKSTYGDAKHSRTWRTALSKDNVSPIYIDWICALYPDISEKTLRTETYSGFLRECKGLEETYERWKSAVNIFRTRRNEVTQIARSFYKSVDHSQTPAFPIKNFPLLTKKGWIRNTPLLLTEQTESSHLEAPEAAPPRLTGKFEGLKVNYSSQAQHFAFDLLTNSSTSHHYNGEIFSATDVILEGDQFVGFKYRLEHYSDYFDTCEYAAINLSDWFSRNTSDPVPASLESRGRPQDAFALNRRASYPGVNCLSIFLNYSKGNETPRDVFWLHRRGENHLEAPNGINVLPAGGHQPFSKGSTREDTAIWHTVVREFIEELFDKESKQPGERQRFLDIPEHAKLADIFFRKPNAAARVFLMGFGLDPATLKPEVLVVILVDWQVARQEGLKLKFNWEFESNDPETTGYQTVPLSQDELLRNAEKRVQSLGGQYLSALPCGSACMKIAAHHLDFLLKYRPGKA